MPKLNSQKQWQKDKPEKVKEYTDRYLANKARILITIPESIAHSIDELKDPSETRTEWVKKLVLEKVQSAAKTRSKAG